MAQYHAETLKQKRRKRQERRKRRLFDTGHKKAPAPARPTLAGNTPSQVAPSEPTKPAVDLNQPVAVLRNHRVLQRTVDILLKAGVTTLADLTAKTADDLRGYGIKPASLDRVVAGLRELGLRLTPKLKPVEAGAVVAPTP